MRKVALIALLLFSTHGYTVGMQDSRELVELPAMMQVHMLANMRDHLAALDEILMHLGNGGLGKAAEVAESRLGMSSMALHDADQLASFMPPGMQQIGATMHKAASYFAVVAQEGDALHAYSALRDITVACVACHSGYRIR